MTSSDFSGISVRFRGAGPLLTSDSSAHRAPVTSLANCVGRAAETEVRQCVGGLPLTGGLVGNVDVHSADAEWTVETFTLIKDATDKGCIIKQKCFRSSRVE